jgi:large subunit ribosomal protein L3
MSALLGKKVGMTGIFDENGQYVPVTVVELGPNYVTQVKTKERDGYDSVQLGYGERSERRITKAVAGHLAKAGTSNVRHVQEVRSFSAEELAALKPGGVLKVGDYFHDGDTVHVVSTSKGRGFQGVVKRHHFGGVGSTTHGQSDRVRAPGSIGASSYPSRVFKGQRMAGRMGGDRITTRNLKIVRVIPEQNLILVSGSFAGAKNQIVEVVKQ